MESGRRTVSACLCAMGWLWLPDAAQAQMPALWQQRWDSGLGLVDEPLKVRRAGAGGSLTLVASDSRRISLLRYEADGTLAWAQVDIAGSWPGKPDLMVADDGSAVLAVVDPHQGGLVVRRFDSVSGVVHWQHSRPLTGQSLNHGEHGPVLAIDPASGHVRVAVAEHGDWLVLDYAPDGTAGGEIVSGSPDRADIPKAILADADGGVVVAGYEAGEKSAGGIRTVAFDAQGNPRYTDREAGDIGSLFIQVSISLAPTQDGGVLVLAGPESTCGTFQSRLWRLDADGQRRWTTVWPENRCQSFEPMSMSVLADGSVIVAAAQRFQLVRIDADGVMRWWRTWFEHNAIPGGAAVAADGRTRITGFEPGWSGPGPRLLMTEWTVDGALCAVGEDRVVFGASAIDGVDDGWVVAASGASLRGQSDAFSSRYPRLEACTADPLFADGFEPFKSIRRGR